MSAKTTSTLSSVVTGILLLILGVLSTFIELVILNGYSEKDGGPALIVFGICQIAGLILSAVFVGWLTKTFLVKYNWNKAPAVIVSILSGTVLGVLLGFPAFIVSVIVAETLR